MSGHSKWSKVKHQKATTDAVKSKAFTRASRALTVAVKEGGGMTDPDKNFRLRLAMEQARAVNMPKDTIQRAIDKAAGGEGAEFQTIVYEGYGPGGVAYLVEATTDNTNRTGSLMKHQFDRAGGALASPGAVSFQFRRSGIVLVEKGEKVSYDMVLDAAVTAGADDVIERDDVFEVYTDPTQLHIIKESLVAAAWSVTHADIVMRPMQSVSPDAETRGKNEEFVEALEEIDDVQTVFTNMD